MLVLGPLARPEPLRMRGTVACVAQGSGRNEECDIAAGGLVRSFLTLSEIKRFRGLRRCVYPWNQRDQPARRNGLTSDRRPSRLSRWLSQPRLGSEPVDGGSGIFDFIILAFGRCLKLEPGRWTE